MGSVDYIYDGDDVWFWVVVCNFRYQSGYLTMNNLSPTPEADSMHGWKFEEPLTKLWVQRLKAMAEIPSIPACGVEYLVERCRRAEAKLAPVTEDELRAMFERYINPHDTAKFSSGEYIGTATGLMWRGFLAASTHFDRVKP